MLFELPSSERATLRNMRWFEIVRQSGHIVDGRVAHFQATIKVGFTLEDSDALAPE